MAIIIRKKIAGFQGIFSHGKLHILKSARKAQKHKKTPKYNSPSRKQLTNRE
jgi:hypothetical protein